jgi:hypothetical protein
MRSTQLRLRIAVAANDTAKHLLKFRVWRLDFPLMRSQIQTIYVSQVRDSAEILPLRQRRNRIRTHDMTEVRK